LEAKMKKIIAFFIILSITLSFVSCGNSRKTPTINGVSLKDYTIVYDEEGLDYNKRAAEYIQNQAKERFGAKLDIIDDDEAKCENEIVVGETSRDISKELNAECEGLQFAITAKGTSIALEGDYFIIAAAAYYFVENYMPNEKKDLQIQENAMVLDPIVKEAKNFILLIGDGMGFEHTTSFEHIENNVEYSDGEDFFYGYLLPYQGESRTDSLSGTTDSAAGGTALSSGYKTYNENVGIDKDDKPVKLLTELAYEKGMSAGVMSTENKTGATPASFSAHAKDRNESAEIILSQAEAIKNYGTIIDCGYDYYNTRYMAVIEKHISDTLNKLSANENGFFLMYEEAHIDKHSHSNDLNKMYQAIVRFNQAIGRFMEYAFYNPDTFVLITADHETGDLYLDDGELKYHYDNHTSKNVPVFAYGDGAELFDGMKVENVQIAQTIAAFMGDDNFGDQTSYKSLTKK
jgi:alkaline phosphatase